MEPKMRGTARRLVIVGLVLGGLVGGAEIGLRLTGIVDFPLYDTDAEIGYVLRPNQSGSFLRRNDWTINECSMASGPFHPHSKKRDVLLVGDSIVWGGNPLRQNERLGPSIEAVAPDCAVWPACAGSWAALNEITWMERHPSVLAEVTDLVWIWNTGDFADRTQWSNELTHPRSRPWSALGYCVEKYVWSSGPALPSANGVVDDGVVNDITRFLQQIRTGNPGLRITLVLYPDKAQMNEIPESPRSFASVFSAVKTRILPAITSSGGGLLDGRLIPEWSEACYRDGIHPTPAANRLMARWISAAIK